MFRQITETKILACTPILANGDPMGPMLNGITYIVRPTYKK